MHLDPLMGESFLLIPEESTPPTFVYYGDQIPVIMPTSTIKRD